MSMANRRTPVLLTVITIALFASAPRADAATITFSQDFSVSSHNEFPAFPGQGQAQRFLSNWHGVGEGWTVPPFDPALGTPEFVEYEVSGVVTISGRLAFGELFVAITLADPFNFSGLGYALATANCASECTFSQATNVGFGVPLAYHVGDPILDVSLVDSPDREATFDLAAFAIIDTSYVGTATATYHYEPFAETVPEPTTGLLIATGLTIGGFMGGRLRASPSTVVRN